VWYFLGYGFFNSQMQEINKKRVELKSNMARLPVLIKETENLEKTIDSLKNAIQSLKNKAFTIKDINKVKQSFIAFSRRYNLKVDEFSAISQIYYKRLQENPDVQYLLLPANMVLEGNFDNFVKMIKNKDQFPYIYNYSYLRIVPSFDKENKVKIFSVGEFFVKKPS
jgi:hypothetical protein